MTKKPAPHGDSISKGHNPKTPERTETRLKSKRHIKRIPRGQPMPLEYKLDPEWCRKILSNPVEVSPDDLEWIKQACKNWYNDNEIPDP